MSVVGSDRRVFITNTEFERIRTVAKRPIPPSAPNQRIPVPRKLGGVLANPTKKSRIPRRRVDYKPLGSEDLREMIAAHERSLAEIESRTRFFAPVEDDGPIQQSRDRIHAIAQQAEELRARRRMELSQFRRAAEENCQKSTFRVVEFDNPAAAKWATDLDALNEIATSSFGC
jgi:hypothetical protein